LVMGSDGPKEPWGPDAPVSMGNFGTKGRTL